MTPPTIIATDFDKAHDDAKDRYYAAMKAFVDTIEPLVAEKVRTQYPDALEFTCSFELTEDWRVIPDAMRVTVFGGDEHTNTNVDAALWDDLFMLIEWLPELGGYGRDDTLEIRFA